MSMLLLPSPVQLRVPPAEFLGLSAAWLPCRHGVHMTSDCFSVLEVFLVHLGCLRLCPGSLEILEGCGKLARGVFILASCGCLSCHVPSPRGSPLPLVPISSFLPKRLEYPCQLPAPPLAKSDGHLWNSHFWGSEALPPGG